MANGRITIDTVFDLLDMHGHADTAEAKAFAHKVARVLQAAIDLGNDPKTALHHIKNSPIRSFEGKTAWDMIEQGRTDDVVDYLRSLSAGFVG